jgi:L-ascorbate metabolism protein UlaG (beta-lactamase superfamily)
MVYATATPCQVLAGQGVAMSQLTCVAPGDVLRFASGSLGSVLGADAGAASLPPHTHALTVTVKRGRHIAYDALLVARTLASPRLLRHLKQAMALAKASLIYVEKGETVAYEINGGGVHITLLGSLGLAEAEAYRPNPDLLVLPYQGHSRLVGQALPIVERLRPRKVLLDHFDDSFAPISRHVDVAPFVQALGPPTPRRRGGRAKARGAISPVSGAAALP